MVTDFSTFVDRAYMPPAFVRYLPPRAMRPSRWTVAVISRPRDRVTVAGALTRWSPWIPEAGPPRQ